MACCFKPRSTTDGSCGSDTSYPVVSANVAALPLIQLPTQLRHADLLTVGRTISSVDPAFVSQKLHLQGGRAPIRASKPVPRQALQNYQAGSVL